MKFWFNANKVNSRNLLNDGALNFPNTENKSLSLSIKNNKDFNDFFFISFGNNASMKMYSPRPPYFSLNPKEFFPRIVKLEKRNGKEYANVEFELVNYTENKKEKEFVLCYLYFNYYQKMEKLLTTNFNLNHKFIDEINEAKKNYKELETTSDILDLVSNEKFELSFTDLMELALCDKEVNASFSLLDGVPTFINVKEETVKYKTLQVTLQQRKVMVNYIATNDYSDKENVYIFRNVDGNIQIEREIKSKESDFTNLYINIFQSIGLKIESNKITEVICDFKKKKDPFFIKSMEESLENFNVSILSSTEKNYENEVCDALFSNNKLNNIEKSLALQILEFENIKYKYYQYMFSQDKSFDALNKEDIETLCMFFPEIEELYNYLTNQTNIILKLISNIDEKSLIKSAIQDLELLK